LCNSNGQNENQLSVEHDSLQDSTNIRTQGERRLARGWQRVAEVDEHPARVSLARLARGPIAAENGRFRPPVMYLRLKFGTELFEANIRQRTARLLRTSLIKTDARK
jgi:hypothetical protein